MFARRVTLRVTKTWLRNGCRPSQKWTTVQGYYNVQSVVHFVCGSHHVFNQPMSIQRAREMLRIWMFRIIQEEVEVTCYDYLVLNNRKRSKYTFHSSENILSLNTLRLEGDGRQLTQSLTLTPAVLTDQSVCSK